MRRQLKISLEGLSLKTRIRVSPVIGGEIRWLLNRPRQKTSPKRAVRDKADTQLAAGRQGAVALHIPGPKRILTLESGDWMNSGRAAQGLDARLR